MDQPPIYVPATDLDDFITERIAKEIEWHERAEVAHVQAGPAYLRLLVRAEQSDTGQARTVANFLASTYNGRAYHFDLYELRNLDVPISDDVLVCLDALRWRLSDLFDLAPNGLSRVEAVIKTWRIKTVRLE